MIHLKVLSNVFITYHFKCLYPRAKELFMWSTIVQVCYIIAAGIEDFRGKSRMIYWERSLTTQRTEHRGVYHGPWLREILSFIITQNTRCPVLKIITGQLSESVVLNLAAHHNYLGRFATVSVTRPHIHRHWLNCSMKSWASVFLSFSVMLMSTLVKINRRERRFHYIYSLDGIRYQFEHLLGKGKW